MSNNQGNWSSRPLPSNSKNTDELQNTHNNLRDTKKKLSRTQAELQDIFLSAQGRQFTPQQTDDKDRKIADLQRTIQELQLRSENLERMLHDTERQLDEQQRLVLQQKATIKHQSQVISNPTPNGNLLSTPHNQQEIHPFGSAPPPRFDLSSHGNQPRYARGYNSGPGSAPPAQNYASSQATQSYGNVSSYQNYGNNQGSQNYGSSQPSQPYGRAQSNQPYGSTQSSQNYGNAAFGPQNFSGTNELGSPAPRNFVQPVQPQTHSRALSIISNPYNQTPLQQPSQPRFDGHGSGTQASQTRIYASMPPPPTLSVISTELVRVVESAAGITEAFEKVFEMAELYAKSHVNFPSTAKDSAVPTTVKDRLIKIASAQTAFPLMSNGQTRYFLVTKLIIGWLIKHVLKFSAFEGFDKESDKVIKTTRDQIYQTTPAILKSMYFKSIANEVRKLHMTPTFSEYLKYLCKERGNQLWGILKPLMHQKTSKDWDDLYFLMEETHKLAGEMLMSADEYRFDVPEPGQRFRQSTMNNRDPFMGNIPGDDLESRNAIVRLGMAPLVTARKNNAQGGVTTCTIHLATVLTKWQGVHLIV